jgi:hypothetical protein
MSPLLKPYQADWAFERCCPASGGRRQSFARNWGGLQRRCQPFASLLTSWPPATTDTIRNDACQGRGQIVRPVNPSAPQVEALDHECRRDSEAGVSGQGNVRVMFSPSLYAGFRAQLRPHFWWREGRLKGWQGLGPPPLHRQVVGVSGQGNVRFLF